jgi:hypothetical protein
MRALFFITNKINNIMSEKDAKIWFYSLESSERNRLSLKYRNTHGYGTFKDYVFLEIYNKEQLKK